MAREKRFEKTFEDIYTGVPKPFKAENVPEDQQYFAGRVEEWGLPDPDQLADKTAYKTGEGYGGRSEKALVSGFQSVKGKEEEGLQDEVTQLRTQMDALGLRNSPLHRMKEQSLLRKFNRTMAPLKQGLVEDVRSNVGRWWQRTGEKFDPIYGGEGKYMESLDKEANVPAWEESILKGRQADLDQWYKMRKAKGIGGIGRFFAGLAENIGHTFFMKYFPKPWDKAGLGGAEEMVRQGKVQDSGDVEYFGKVQSDLDGIWGKSAGAVTGEAWREWSGAKEWEKPTESAGIITMPKEFAELELPDVLKEDKLESLKGGITYGGLMRDYRRGAV